MLKCFKYILSIKHLKYITCFILLDIICLILIILTKINISKIEFYNLEDLKNEIFQNQSFPMFHFYIGLESPSQEHLYYDSFYTWQGTIKKFKEELNPVKINKIFNNKFFYEKTNKTYLDYLKTSVKKGENCDENNKKCGILDSNNNILCIPNNEECPINDLKISDTELYGLIPEYNHIELIESLTGIKKYIYFTNNKIDNNIITNFKLSFDNPCIAPNEHSWISLNKNEKEKSCKCFTYINEKLYDPSYIEVGNNIFMKSLYYDNEIKIFNDFSSEKVKLYTKNYYYINEECSLKYIIDYDNFVKYKNDFFRKIKIFEYINLFLIIIHFCLFLYVLKSKKKSVIFIIILNFVLIYVVIANCVLIFNLNKKSNLDFSCGGEVINAKINYFINEKLFFQTKAKLFIFIFLGIIIIELIFQNLVFYSIKKSQFRRLSIKSDIF